MRVPLLSVLFVFLFILIVDIVFLIFCEACLEPSFKTSSNVKAPNSFNSEIFFYIIYHLKLDFSIKLLQSSFI